MGLFLNKILKKLHNAKGQIVDGKTMTGQQPNQIIVNPDIQMRAESFEHEIHHTIFWGRANPPHAGHEAAYKVVQDTAKKYGGTTAMLLSRSHDPNKNPLSPENKEKHAKRAFPRVHTEVADEQHPTLLHQLAKMHKAGITHAHIVAGSDRIPEYKSLIDKYNGVEGRHGMYKFNKISIHSSGERDPDSEGVGGISASKMREHAKNNNYQSFAAGAPSTMKPHHVKEMFDDVRKGLGTVNENFVKSARCDVCGGLSIDNNHTHN